MKKILIVTMLFALLSCTSISTKLKPGKYVDENGHPYIVCKNGDIVRMMTEEQMKGPERYTEFGYYQKRDSVEYRQGWFIPVSAGVEK